MSRRYSVRDNAVTESFPVSIARADQSENLHLAARCNEYDHKEMFQNTKISHCFNYRLFPAEFDTVYTTSLEGTKKTRD